MAHGAGQCRVSVGDPRRCGSANGAKRRCIGCSWSASTDLRIITLRSFPGGMQKRVSIVRTLIYEPAVVLLDEPFGALDAQTRMGLHHELLELWREKKSTMLFITHDLVEAITLSDQIVVMTRRPGRVKEIYEVPLARPRNVFEIYLEPGFELPTRRSGSTSSPRSHHVGAR